MAYSAVTDLLIGDTRIDGVIDALAYVNAAADEIDAQIGNIYVTPVSIDDSPVNRPSLLLLKQINNYLATGRILLTLSRTAEDKKLDSLGSYYVKFALDALSKLADGEVTLFGATRSTNDTGPTYTGPRTVNDDPESLVDYFYTRMNPSNISEHFISPLYPKPRPGSTL